MKYIRTTLSLATILALLIITRTAHASSSVQINEIAWMGTSVSANAEWIELYNPDSNPVDLNGWKLSSTDGSPNIVLSGTISGNGYFLLERTSDSTLPSITANQIYTGALSNSGEHLQLINSTGTIVDDVDGSNGWSAGDDTTKNTMQRNGSSWITGTPTPGTANVITASSSTTTSTSMSDQGSDDTASQISSSAKSAYSLAINPDPTYSAQITIPDKGVSGISVPMTVSVKVNNHKDMVSGKFMWNYGDGSADTFVHNTPANHIYHYTGTYTVVLVYYSDEIKEDPDYLFKKTIVIIPSDISLISTTDDGGIIIQNNSTDTIDLDSWIIQSGDKKYIFPKYTFISSSGKLYLSSYVLKFIIASRGFVTLSNPSNVLISHYDNSHR
jgi:hypothetical protein